jgi:hypothetical protein
MRTPKSRKPKFATYPDALAAMLSAPTREAFAAALRDAQPSKRGRPPKAAAEREAALGERAQRKTNAWRDDPSRASDAVWGEWEAKAAAEQPDADPKAIQSYLAVVLHKAFMRFHKTGEIAPLLTTLRSEGVLAPANPESLTRLIESLHVSGQPRKEGRPGGTHSRWRRANYIAAWIAEPRLAEYQGAQTKAGDLTDDERLKVIDEVIEEMQHWHATKKGLWIDKDPFDRERVLKLLHDSKRKRL